MNPAWLRNTALLLVAWWIVVFALSAPGLYTIDELIQVGAIDALARFGSLTLNNGYETFGRKALLLWFSVAGPNGVVSQYPSGYAVLAAPFYLLGGIKGLYTLNFLAGVGVVALAYRIALMLAGSSVARLTVVILLGATFLVDYTAAIWPHSLTAFLAVAGTYCILQADASRNSMPWSVVSGLCFALGLNVRYDIVLLIPALVFWLLVWANRPYRLIALAALGVLPGVALSSALNWWKFGTLNPLSYGEASGGNASLAPYLILGAVLLAAFAVTSLWRAAQPYRRPIVIGTAIAAGAAIVLVPELHRLAEKTLRGFLVLGYDLTLSSEVDRRPGVVTLEDGRVLFFGVHKKALVQSMPWLGCLPLLALGRGYRSKAVQLALLAGVTTMLPFAMKQWHGGYSNNLRYLLPALPFLSLLGAAGLDGLVRQLQPKLWPFVASLLLWIFGFFAFFVLARPLASDVLQHLLPNILFLALLVCSLAVLWLSRLQGLLLQVLAMCFALAAVSANVIDLRQQYEARLTSARLADHLAALPPQTLVYVRGAHRALPVLLNPDQYLATIDRITRKADWALVDKAIGQGLNVATVDDEIAQVLSKRPDLAAPEHFASGWDDYPIYLFRPKAGG